MDIANFFIPQAATSGSGQMSANTPTARAMSGTQTDSSTHRSTSTQDRSLPSNVTGFFDLLFTQLAQTGEGTSTASTENTETELLGDTGLTNALMNNPELFALLKDAAIEQNTDLDLDLSGTSLSDMDRQTLFSKLKDLLAGIPELETQGILSSKATGTEETFSDLISMDLLSDQDLADIEDIMSMQKELMDAGIPALIATNLSPEDLKYLTENFSEEELQEPDVLAFALAKIIPVDEKDIASALSEAMEINMESNSSLTSDESSEGMNEDMLAAFMAQLQATLQQDANTNQNVSQASKNATQDSKSAIPTGAEPTNALAAQLNNIVVGGSEDALPEDSLEDGELSLFGDSVSSNGKVKSGSEQNVTSSSSATENNTSTAQNVPALPSWMSEAFGSILAEQGWEESWLNGFDLDSSNNTLNSLSLNSAQSLTSPLIYAANATQAHPATQTVAMSLTKMASNGETKSLTLELDPPDLGRVEVKMEFGEDKKIRAHLLIEKPETYNLLQRDAQTLEKALTQAGIDVSNDSLNFTLAGGESDFMGQEQRQGSHDGYSSDSITGADGEDIELIETTLGIEFDPDTGLPRLNMMV